MLPSLFVLLCVVARILPHPLNFAPVGAVAVLAGRTLKPWQAFLLLGIAMLLGDLALSGLRGYPLADWTTPFVYAGFSAQAGLGYFLRRRRGGAIGAAVSGAMVFFLISNFGVWATSGMYPRNWAGLGTCYTMALPFLGGTLAGDAVWTLVFTFAYRAAGTRLSPNPRWVPVPLAELSAY